MEDTPRRFRTASWKPPPMATMSRKKRNASKKLDFPDALAPTKKTLCCKLTSAFAKFLQLLKEMFVNRTPVSARRCRLPSERSLDACMSEFTAGVLKKHTQY